MRPLGVSPRIENWDRPATNSWLSVVGERLQVYRGDADPTPAEVPEDQWVLYYNTTTSDLRFWVNIDGVMFKTAALT